MKTRKNTRVGNFEIDMDMYNDYEKRDMLNEKDYIFFISNDDSFKIVTSTEDKDVRFFPDYHQLRIDYDVCTEVKVIYNKELGYYMNVVKTIDGEMYYINL